MTRKFRGKFLIGFAYILLASTGCDPRQVSQPTESDADTQPQRILSAPPLSVTPLEYSPVPSLIVPKPRRKAFRPDMPESISLKPADVAAMEILNIKDLLQKAQELNHSLVRLRARVVESQDDYWLLYDGSTMQYVGDRRPPATPGFAATESSGPSLVKVSPHVSNINLNDEAEIVGTYDAASNTIQISSAKVIFTGLEK